MMIAHAVFFKILFVVARGGDAALVKRDDAEIAVRLSGMAHGDAPFVARGVAPAVGKHAAADRDDSPFDAARRKHLARRVACCALADRAEVNFRPLLCRDGVTVHGESVVIYVRKGAFDVARVRQHAAVVKVPQPCDAADGDVKCAVRRRGNGAARGDRIGKRFAFGASRAVQCRNGGGVDIPRDLVFQRRDRCRDGSGIAGSSAVQLGGDDRAHGKAAFLCRRISGVQPTGQQNGDKRRQRKRKNEQFPLFCHRRTASRIGSFPTYYSACRDKIQGMKRRKFPNLHRLAKYRRFAQNR